MIYDLFLSNKGKPVRFSTSSYRSQGTIRSLREYYGLDLSSVGPGKWVLRGEYINDLYVDYMEVKA